MAAAPAASMGVVREVLGADVVEEVDQPIIDYIANVLADEDFDFGAPEGHGIFEALGELLIDSGCVSDQEHCVSAVPVQQPATDADQASFDGKKAQERRERQARPKSRSVRFVGPEWCHG